MGPLTTVCEAAAKGTLFQSCTRVGTGSPLTTVSEAAAECKLKGTDSYMSYHDWKPNGPSLPFQIGRSLKTQATKPEIILLRIDDPNAEFLKVDTKDNTNLARAERDSECSQEIALADAL